MSEERKIKEMSPQIAAAYKSKLDHLSFLKQRQWTITNYVIAIYGAIFVLSKDIAATSGPKYALSILVIAALIYGIFLIFRINNDLEQTRQGLDNIDADYFLVTERQRYDLPEHSNRKRTDCPFLIALILVPFVGACLVILNLWKLL